ncbi:MAG TPA: hypothetical protein PKD64_19380 [Pirellulaceae bacterium]|nr:hypothetical protein [Pirellulaceae bacterium]HMO94354.1 hypothetical protein [Pirellulaceae bacterium]HMP71391.1 hypothetical protein [Pirellulaceae bacterium]
MTTTYSGVSDAARLLEETRKQIFARCNNAVTLSRNEAVEAVFEAWQATDEDWKVGPDEIAVAEEVKDAAIRFIQNLPLGFPQPEVSREADGHINLAWYRTPRRVFSVSIAPNNRLHWAALIGTESPRGTSWYLDRIPISILDLIARVFEGD